MKNLHTKKTSNGSNFGWLIWQMSINQKSWRKTFRRRFVSGSLFVSPCPPDCYFQSETKIEPNLRLGRHQHKHNHKAWTNHRSLSPRPRANKSKAIWQTKRPPSYWGWRELYRELSQIRNSARTYVLMLMLMRSRKPGLKNDRDQLYGANTYFREGSILNMSPSKECLL